MPLPSKLAIHLARFTAASANAAASSVSASVSAAAAASAAAASAAASAASSASAAGATGAAAAGAGWASYAGAGAAGIGGTLGAGAAHAKWGAQAHARGSGTGTGSGQAPGSGTGSGQAPGSGTGSGTASSGSGAAPSDGSAGYNVAPQAHNGAQQGQSAAQRRREEEEEDDEAEGALVSSRTGRKPTARALHRFRRGRSPTPAPLPLLTAGGANPHHALVQRRLQRVFNAAHAPQAQATTQGQVTAQRSAPAREAQTQQAIAPPAVEAKAPAAAQASTLLDSAALERASLLDSAALERAALLDSAALDRAASAQRARLAAAGGRRRTASLSAAASPALASIAGRPVPLLAAAAAIRPAYSHAPAAYSHAHAPVHAHPLHTSARALLAEAQAAAATEHAVQARLAAIHANEIGNAIQQRDEARRAARANRSRRQAAASQGADVAAELGADADVDAWVQDMDSDGPAISAERRAARLQFYERCQMHIRKMERRSAGLDDALVRAGAHTVRSWAADDILRDIVTSLSIADEFEALPRAGLDASPTAGTARFQRGYGIVMQMLVATRRRVEQLRRLGRADAPVSSAQLVARVVRLYLEMIADGDLPTGPTLGPVIQALASEPDGRALAPKRKPNAPKAAAAAAAGAEPAHDNYAQALSLLRAAHRFSGTARDKREAARRLPPDVWPYNALLAAAAARGDEAVALEVLALLEQRAEPARAHPLPPVRATGETFESLLNAFAPPTPQSHAARHRRAQKQGQMTAEELEQKRTVVRSIFQDWLEHEKMHGRVAHRRKILVWNAFIRALFALQDVPAAIGALAQMLQRYADSAGAGAGAAHANVGAATEAAADVDADAEVVGSVENAPLPGPATMDIVLLGLLQNGQLQQAAEWYGKMRELAPRGLAQPSRAAVDQLALALMESAEPASADALRTTGLDASPSVLAALITKRVDEGALDDAQALVQRIAHDTPGVARLADALVALADCLLAQGRAPDAAAVFERAFSVLAAGSGAARPAPRTLGLLVALGARVTQPEAQLPLRDALGKVVQPILAVAAERGIESEQILQLQQNLVALCAAADSPQRAALGTEALNTLFEAFAAVEANSASTSAEEVMQRGLGALLQDVAHVGHADASGLDVRPLAAMLFDRYGPDAALRLGPLLQPAFAATLANQPWRLAAASHPSPPAPSSPLDSATSADELSSAATTAPPPFPAVQLIDEDLSERLVALSRVWSSSAKGAGVPDQTPFAAQAQIFNALNAAIAVGDYPTPQALADILAFVGRQKDVGAVDYLYAVGAHLLTSASGPIEWKANGWAHLEDAMMTALAHTEQTERANLQRHQMIAEGRVPSANSYAALISVIRETTDDALIAQELFDESQRLGVRPNAYLFNTIISKLSRARKGDRALQLFSQMDALGIRPTSVTYGAIISACCRIGDEARAAALFEKMEQDRTFKAKIPPYNTMIQFYIHTRPDKVKALHYLDKARKARVRLNSHSYKLLIDLHGTVEPFHPKMMMDTIRELDRDPYVPISGTHWAAVINAYGNAMKDLDEAEHVFFSISSHPSGRDKKLPDVVCYEALFSVYATHGKLPLMRKQMEKMIERGVRPTAYLGNILIKALASTDANGLEEARAIFRQMLDPAVGVAAAGNHGPRTHGAGAVLAPDAPAAEAHDAGRLPPLDPANPWASVYREPSTYTAMITAELGAGNIEAAKELLDRMTARAFPGPVILQASALISDAESAGASAAAPAAAAAAAPAPAAAPSSA